MSRFEGSYSPECVEGNSPKLNDGFARWGRYAWTGFAVETNVDMKLASNAGTWMKGGGIRR